MDAVEFVPAHREEILNVTSRTSIVSEFVMVMETKMIFVNAKVEHIFHGFFFVFVVIFLIISIFAEPLMFHLLKFNCPENEVSRCDFISKRFANLRNSKRHFCPASALNIEEIDKFALCCFWTQINFVLSFFCYTTRSFKHKVELSYWCPVELSAFWTANFVLHNVILHLFIAHKVRINLAF